MVNKRYRYWCWIRYEFEWYPTVEEKRENQRFQLKQLEESLSTYQKKKNRFGNQFSHQPTFDSKRIKLEDDFQDDEDLLFDTPVPNTFNTEEEPIPVTKVYFDDQ